MTQVFADSFYFFALLNPHDTAHSKALAFSSQESVTLVTTIWVLSELADGLARSADRRIFRRVLLDLQTAGDHEILPGTDELWNKGVDLYDARRDKQWSLTDCISFVAMKDRGITEALTGDHHFVQAGFSALLQ